MGAMEKAKSARQALRFRFRGREVEIDRFSPRLMALDWLRDEAGAKGTKEGCAEGDCGACTVVLARLRAGKVVYEAVNACILLLGQLDGAEIITVEDLAEGDALHPVQQAMVDHHGSQCGFCTPGIVMSLFAAYHSGAPATHAGLCDLFAGDDAGFFASPASLDSLAALYERFPDATLVSGATDVGLWITKQLRDPRRVIWLGRVAGLDAVEDQGKTLSIGAGVTLADASPLLAKVHPDLGEIMRRFGSMQVRSSGTVGGTIANGSPIGDLAPALMALGGRVVLRKGDAVRAVPLEDFFIAYGKQDRAPGEFVLSVEAPRLLEGQHYRALKVSKRFDEDISAVMLGARMEIEDGRIVAARVAYGGMAATPKRAANAEKALAGKLLDDRPGWSSALHALEKDFAPLTDQRATAAYRMAVAKNVLEKALVEMAGSSAPTRLGGLNAA